MYKRFLFPLLQRGDPETIHEKTVGLLEIAQRRVVGRAFLRLLAGKLPEDRVSVLGLDFPNKLGVAAGYDKDCRIAPALAMLGFGHVEVGTITPKPQLGNSKPRVFRLASDKAIINRMGFPNCGSVLAAEHLKRLKRISCNFILGVSLGKQKETPLLEAADDYLQVMSDIYPYADYLAINLSSPNTPGLRELQGPEYLDHLLTSVSKHGFHLAELHNCKSKPLLIKISPDLTYPELDILLDSCLEHDIAGIIATNTTLERIGLTGKHKNEPGGLSGLPLARSSNKLLEYIYRQLGDQLALVGVGGVLNHLDVLEKISKGAALVQVYTGLVYEGPQLAGRILRGLTV